MLATRFSSLPTFFPVPELRAAPGPALDVWTEGEELVVAAELPGLATDSLEVTLERGVLHLRGERSAPDKDGVTLLHRERRTGAFSRSLRLPFRVDANGIQARYEAGVLEVRLPRADEDRPKRIDVTTGD